MKADLHIDNRCLIEECQKGEKEAMSLFYTRFAPRMLGVIKRYVSDPKDAEDILHDGFIVAFTRLASLKNYDKVDFWLASIMKNLSLQFLHDQDITTMLHDLPEVADAPEFDDIIDIETLETLIAKLPPGYQKVFRLAVLENKSHKEIARILGIAPNSSSSQLFHARLMMRQLIKEHRYKTGLLSILLLAISGISLFTWHTLKYDKYEAPAPGTYLTESHPTDEPSKSQYTNILANNVSINNVSANNTHNSGVAHIGNISFDETSAESAPNDNTDHESIIVSSEGQKPSQSPDSDKRKTNNSQPDNLDTNFTTHEAETTPLLHNSTTFQSRHPWSVGLSVNTGLFAANQNNLFLNASWSESLPPDDNPDNPSDNGGSEEPTRATRSSDSPYRDYNSVTHHNYLPLSVSFALKKQFSNTIGVETGISYTYLHTRFEASSSESHCHWHYLGIPLKLDIKLYETGRLRMYASAGGSVDFPLYSVADVTAIGTYIDLKPGRFHSPVVWSVGAACGVGIKISDRLELFVEPTLQYHFGTSHKVPNSWTDNPAGFSLPLGLRLNL